MGKKLNCKDVTGDCEFQARADNEQDLMRQVQDHARTRHNIAEITPELASKVRSAIRDEA